MLDKDGFLEEYKLSDVFQCADITWDVLELIYNDYKERYEDLQDKAEKIVKTLRDENCEAIRSIYGRAKHPKHLIAKIIRKLGKEHNAKYNDINTNSYMNIVRDLIGVRVLVLAKEQWYQADSVIRKYFNDFPEPPKAYMCYGDRDIFDESIIETDYTNRGYRSQHYIVSLDGYFAEIQVRTLAEEVFGELDHAVRYPKQEENTFLKRYGRIVSKCTSELDELVSTCLDLSKNEKLINSLHNQFAQDRYKSWSSETHYKKASQDVSKEPTVSEEMTFKELGMNKYQRKGN